MKTIKTILILGSLATLLSSCSEAAEQSKLVDGEYRLIVSGKNEAMIKALKVIEKDYEKEHPGIKLGIQYLDTSSDGGSISSDIGFGTATQINEAVDQDLVEVLPVEYADLIKERISENCVNAFLYNDTFACLPIGISTGPSFYYNTSIFSENDVSSWDKIFLTTSALPTEKKNALSYFSPAEYMGAFYANGVDTKFTKSGNLDDFNSEKALKIAKGLSKLLSNTLLDANVSELPEGDDYVSCAGVEYTKGSISNYFGDNLGVATLPSFAFENETFKWSSHYITEGIAIKKQTNDKKREVLFSFAEYISRYDSVLYEDYSVNKGMLKFVDNYPVIAAEAKDGKEYTAYPMEWYSIMYRLIDKIKADNGELNEERLRSALNDYHDQVMAL